MSERQAIEHLIEAVDHFLAGNYALVRRCAAQARQALEEADPETGSDSAPACDCGSNVEGDWHKSTCPLG